MTLLTEQSPNPWLFTFRRHPILFSFVLALFLDVAIKPLGVVFFGDAQAIPLWFLLPLRLVSLGLWLLFAGCVIQALARVIWRAFQFVVGEDASTRLREGLVAAATIMAGFLWIGFGIWYDIGQNANSVGEASAGWSLILNSLRTLVGFAVGG